MRSPMTRTRSGEVADRFAGRSIDGEPPLRRAVNIWWWTTRPRHLPVIQRALIHDDFTIDCVSEPGPGRAQLEPRITNVIILDYVIPGLDTEDVLRWLHEHQTQPASCVTGYRRSTAP